MNDRLSALKLFARAARVGNFSRAGRELGLSQPSASRLIAALEEEIGATLFIRTTRAVTLTEAGATYLMRVEAILAALDEADHDANHYADVTPYRAIDPTLRLIPLDQEIRNTTPSQDSARGSMRRILVPSRTAKESKPYASRPCTA